MKVSKGTAPTFVPETLTITIETAKERELLIVLFKSNVAIPSLLWGAGSYKPNMENQQNLAHIMGHLLDGLAK